jgi:hypothetical protein
MHQKKTTNDYEIGSAYKALTSRKTTSTMI